MSNAIVKADNGMDLMSYGKIFAQSGFFSDSKDAAQAIVKIQAGAELGFPPVASMTGVHIIKGRVSLSANLIAAAIKRSGKYTYRVLSLSDDGCELEFFEAKESIGKSAFGPKDAKRQSTQNIDRFPRNMFFARAISNGAKWYCPDVFGGPVYTPDELGAEVDAEGEPIHAAPQRRQPDPTPEVVADEPHDAADIGDDEAARIALRELIDQSKQPSVTTEYIVKQEHVADIGKLSPAAVARWTKALASRMNGTKKPEPVGV